MSETGMGLAGTATQTKTASHAVNRRCELLRENGEQCRGIPAIGETRCHAHMRYQESAGRMTIAVPLLDDEASILFLISQTVRALAQGVIPPQNGQAMLQGCRLALRVLEHRLDRERVELCKERQNSAQRAADSVQRAADSAQRAADSAQRAADSAQRAADSARRGGEQGADDAEPTVSQNAGTRVGQPGTSGPEDQEPCTTESAEDTEKASVEVAAGLQSYPTEEEPRAAESHFPNLKKKWDRALLKTEMSVADAVAPHEGESWYDVIRRKEVVKREARTEMVSV